MQSKFNKKIIIEIVIALIVLFALIKIIGIITEPKEISNFKKIMKDKGYTVKNISASDIQAQDTKTGQIIEAVKNSDECILAQFEDGNNAEVYFQTMYLITTASGSKAKMLKQSSNFFKIDPTGIDYSEDKMISKEKIGYIVYSRKGNIVLIIISDSENSAISLSEELGY